MKILSTKAGFTSKVFPGRFCFHLSLSNYGVDIVEDDLVKQAIHFPRIVIDGEEPFLQKEALARFIKKVRMHNPKLEFDIFTTGVERPVKIGNIEHVNYIVSVIIGSHMFNHKLTTKNQNFLWFSQMMAHFLFFVKTDDDIENVIFFIREYNIDKSRTYLAAQVKEDMSMLIKKAKIIGCNVLFDEQEKGDEL